MKPRQPLAAQATRTVPIPVRCGRRTSRRPPPRTGGGFLMGVIGLRCRACGEHYEAEARYVCTRCFGPVEVAYDHAALAEDPAALRRRIQAGPAEPVALRRPAAGGGPGRRRPAAARPHAARARRPAGRAPRPGRGVGQERHRQPDALVQGPRRGDRGAGGARARLRHARLLLDREPRQRRRRPRRRARAAELRLHPVRPRGAEGPRERRLRHDPRQGPRHLRRRQPARHRGQRGARGLGLRQRQPAPLLRRGLEDHRLRGGRAARLGAARPGRRADRLGVALHEGRQGLRRAARPRARRRGAARHAGRAGHGLRAGRLGLGARRRPLRAGQAPHDRQVAGDRLAGRRALRAGHRAGHGRRRSRPSPTTRSAPASACWARRPGSSRRPPAA